MSKRRVGFVGVDNFDLTIADEEFLVLLGPSGCGKTTTMRMIAGLEDATEGEIVTPGAGGERPRAGGPRHRHGVPERRALPEPQRSRSSGRSGGRSRSPRSPSARSGPTRSGCCIPSSYRSRRNSTRARRLTAAPSSGAVKG